MPLISICIPSYNGSNSIKKTLESVLNQTFRDFEIIVNDDCSSDDTEQIVKSFNDKRIQFSKNPKQLGAAQNCNKALELATGKYVKILMQDDIIHTKHLEKSLALLENDPNIVMTTCQSYVINKDDEILSSRKKFKTDKIIDGTTFSKKSLRGRNIFGEPSIICFRRSAVTGGLKYDTNFKFNFDWDFSIRIAEDGKIAYIAEPLASFRIDGSSISSNYYIKNKKLIYNESKEMFLKHKNSGKIHLNGFDFLIFKVNTLILLFLKMVYVFLAGIKNNK